MRKAMLYHQNPIYLDKLQIPPLFCSDKVPLSLFAIDLALLKLSVTGWGFFCLCNHHNLVYITKKKKRSS